MTPHDYLLLERYVAGDCTPEERRRVEQWVAADPTREAAVDEARLIWANSAPVDLAFDNDASWAAVRRRLDVTSDQLRRGRGPTQWAPLTRGAFHWAGVLTAVFVVMVTLAVWRPWSVGEAGAREYATAVGQRLRITLPDGTQFVLAPDSRIRVGAAYAHGTRDLWLTGEAYFVVKHDILHPFVVHTPWANARDVGTAFNVQAYAEDAETKVAVAQGEVAVGSTLLGPGEVATVSAGHTTIASGVNVAAISAWTQGHLSFSDTPLRAVIVVLARTYGVSITLADSTLGHELVTGTFGDQPVDSVLDAVTAVTGARYQRQGRHVVIARKIPAHGSPARHVTLRELQTAEDSHE